MLTKTQARAAADMILMLMSLEDQMTPGQRDRLDELMNRMGDGLIALSRYAANEKDAQAILAQGGL